MNATATPKVKVYGEKQASALSREEERLISQNIYSGIMSDDMGEIKTAANTLGDYTRLKVYEESYSDAILPPIKIEDADLVPNLTDEKNMFIAEMQTDSVGAATVPYGMSPQTFSMHGRRYPVMLSRRQSQRYQKDVSLLRTWKMDIRQIFSDSAVKDVHTERDRCWQSAVDNVNPTPGATNPLSQAVMYKTLSGGFSRNNGWDMTKITRDTELSIAPVTAVCNHITLIEWLKLDRTEMGGDMAERIMTKGVAEINGLFTLNWIGTIKKRLIPFGHVYLYPATDFLGKSVYIEQLTMNIKKEGPTVQFYMYDEGGSSIGNIGSFGHLHFTGV